MDKKYALEINDLFVEFRVNKTVVKAVNGMSLSLEKGRTLGLVGETGAGKTTTALSVLKLIPNPPGKIVSGSIKLDGEEILKLSKREMISIRGNKVSMIFQDPMTSLNPVMTVESQIAEILEFHGSAHLNPKERIQKAHEMLELVGIPKERGGEYPNEFSGGMKQRVVIAMALACNPDVLIADEPTTALDVTIQAQVLDMMRNLREKYNMAMLMITHDLGVVAEICDDVSVVYAGRVIEHGNLDDIYNHTMHPYTKGLFNSLPNINNREVKLEPIPGLMPDPSNLPSGCPFHPRCKYAKQICKSKLPDYLYISDSHYVACHLYDENHTESFGGDDDGK